MNFSKSSCLNRAILLLIAAQIAIVFLASNLFLLSGTSPEIATTPELSAATTKQPIFGLLHMFKTAGTEINGELAMHYERVCGNKGYSYDAYQANRRTEEARTKENCTAVQGCVRDSMTKLYDTEKRNRGRIDPKLMTEIGFEDCDYVAIEVKHTFWESQFLPVGGPATKKELHIPCRKDPVDHLMSMANHLQKKFLCSTKNLKAETKRLISTWGRFHQSLLQLGPNMTVKCFNPIPIEPYLEYMSNKLQRRKIESAYIHRESNKQKRNKENECVWKNEVVRNMVEKILVEEDSYFSYCKTCLGSKNDLLNVDAE